MNNIILHVGPGKTGSSAIQHWLVKQRKELADHGIYYPEHKLDSNGISAGHALTLFDRDKDQNLVISTKKVAKLKEGFAASNCHTLLLSSEAFAVRIESIIAQFPKCKVIYYFRSPIESAESVYNQSIKRHFNTKVFNTRRMNIKRLEEFFGIVKNNASVELDIRPYGKAFFKRGDIVSDFMDAVDPTFNVHAPSRVINTSYSFEALEFKRLLNEVAAQGFHRRLDRFLQGYKGKTLKYTFVSNEEKKVHSEKLIKKVKKLFANSDYCSEPLVQVLQSFSDKPFASQQKTEQTCYNEFGALLESMKTTDTALFIETSSLVLAYSSSSTQLKLLKNVIKQTKLSFIDKMAVYFWVVKWKLTSTKGQNES